MVYPNPYFRLYQWVRPPAQSQQRAPRPALNRYSYGRAARATAFIRLAPTANFSAAPPFDFFTIGDALGKRATFEFRPAGGPPSVAGRFPIDLTGAVTAIQVAGRTQTAINDRSSVGPQLSAFLNGSLGVLAQLNTNPTQSDELTLVMQRPGPSAGVLDVSGVVGVAGFVARGWANGSGGMLAGRTRASGGLVTPAAVDLVAGERFTLSDGVTARAFIFQKAGAPVVNAPDVAVPIVDGQSAAAVAAIVEGVINATAAPPAGPGSTFAVTAALDPAVGPSALRLVNDLPGARGGGMFFPLFITDTVAHVDFQVWGMVGGQDGSVIAPARFGPVRAALPTDFGWERN